MCVKFYSHMYGSSVGYLSLESSNKTDPWLTLYGDQGDQWVWHQVTVNLIHGEQVSNIPVNWIVLVVLLVTKNLNNS